MAAVVSGDRVDPDQIERHAKSCGHCNSHARGLVAEFRRLQRFAANANEARRQIHRRCNDVEAHLQELREDRNSEERWANEYSARAETAEAEVRRLRAALDGLADQVEAQRAEPVQGRPGYALGNWTFNEGIDRAAAVVRAVLADETEQR